MTAIELEKDKANNVFEAIEKARVSGKIKKGTNEVTKIIEKGKAKLVAIANDVNPPEIIMHIPILCDEKNVLCFKIGTRDELGSAAGLDVSTVAVVVVDEGEAKSIIQKLNEEYKE